MRCDGGEGVRSGGVCDGSTFKGWFSKGGVDFMEV